MIQYLNVFFYDIYPYLCGTVFLVGSWLRYDYGQYTWRASSSQMLDKRGMVALRPAVFSAGLPDAPLSAPDPHDVKTDVL